MGETTPENRTPPEHRPQRKRRWLTYSLRTLLLTIPVLGAALWLVLRPYQLQREVSSLVDEAGGVVGVSVDPSTWLGRWLVERHARDVHLIAVDRCEVSDALLDRVARLPNLDTLAIGNARFSDDQLRRLQTLTSLRVLYLDAPGVSEDAVKSLRSAIPELKVHRVCADQPRILATIKAHGGKVQFDYDLDPAVPEILRTGRSLHPPWWEERIGHDRLNEVVLVTFRASSTVNAAVISDCAKGLPGLRIVILSNVNDAVLEPLSRMTGLENLQLGGKHITSAGMVHLAGFSNLRKLFLGFTNVGDEGLTHLARLTNLKHLDLRYTKVGDKGLAHLAGLTNLEDLTLFRTNVTDEGLVHLRHHASLRTLRLHGTQVTDAGIRELREFLPDCTIYGHSSNTR